MTLLHLGVWSEGAALEVTPLEDQGQRVPMSVNKHNLEVSHHCRVGGLINYSRVYLARLTRVVESAGEKSSWPHHSGL